MFLRSIYSILSPIWYLFGTPATKPISNQYKTTKPYFTKCIKTLNTSLSSLPAAFHTKQNNEDKILPLFPNSQLFLSLSSFAHFRGKEKEFKERDAS